jgi:RNA polymerase sigma-32 factor
MSTETSGRWLDVAIRTQRNWTNLGPERERQLLRIYQTSTDEEERQTALTALWESHSKLVVAIAIRYRRRNIELVDLIGAGHLGLHTAIARFDVERFETRLATYAIGWIRSYIQDYIRRNAAPVRLPASAAHRQLARSARRLFADARRSCERENVDATEAELYARIGRRLGLDADEVAASLRLIYDGALSFDGEQTEAAGGTNLEETLAAERESPEEDVIHRLDNAKVRKRIMQLVNQALGERERAVFLARCMRDDGDVVHLDTLAQQFGVTRERVSQLEASAKRKIATVLAQEGYGGPSVTAVFSMPAVRAQRRAATAPADRPSSGKSASLAVD